MDKLLVQSENAFFFFTGFIFSVLKNIDNIFKCFIIEWLIFL